MRPMALALAVIPTLALATEVDVDELASASREAVAQFAPLLKQELVTALEAGGPVNAIQVCSEIAPDIAATVSRDAGLTVARTSLKYRNPDNAPDDWEREVLQDFESRRAAGESAEALEHYELVESGGDRRFRYMKAIPTAELCVRCHGTQLGAEVEAKLEQLYQEDQARGFEVGDIRGAFTVSKGL